MSSPKRLLIVDDERDICRLLTRALRNESYTVVAAHSGEEALQRFAETPFPVVVLDIILGGIDGLTVLKDIRAQRPETHVIMLTAHASIESAIEALRLGAGDYVRKGPQVLEEILFRVARAFEAIGLGQRTQRLQRELERMQDTAGMIGSSPPMQELYSLIARVAVADVNVLIRGETGTGKELVAKALHAGSPRHDKPFVPVDCNIPETLAESMLFGVSQNYPGLHRKEPLTGLFELADGGTLFLDEIGDLPLVVQPKLLRAIQEGEIRPLGAPHTVKVDVRIIAATNRQLEQAMQEGHFRSDLYHRLDVMTLETTPLRQRKEDISALVQHFLTKACKRQKRSQLQVADEALEVLLAYDYPGNVRELEHLIERAVLLTTHDTIQPEVLPVRAGTVSFSEPVSNLSETLAEVLSRTEKSYMESLLRYTKGNISQAANRAGIDRKNFREKLKKYGITVDGYLNGDQYDA